MGKQSKNSLEKTIKGFLSFISKSLSQVIFLIFNFENFFFCFSIKDSFFSIKKSLIELRKSLFIFAVRMMSSIKVPFPGPNSTKLNSS